MICWKDREACWGHGLSLKTGKLERDILGTRLQHPKFNHNSTYYSYNINTQQHKITYLLLRTYVHVQHYIHVLVPAHHTLSLLKQGVCTQKACSTYKEFEFSTPTATSSQVGRLGTSTDSPNRDYNVYIHKSQQTGYLKARTCTRTIALSAHEYINSLVWLTRDTLITNYTHFVLKQLYWTPLETWYIHVHGHLLTQPGVNCPRDTTIYGYIGKVKKMDTHHLLLSGWELSYCEKR